MQDNARAALVEAISQRQKLMGKVTEASKRNSTRAFPDEMICKHAQAVTKLMQEQDQALDKVPNIAKTQLKSAAHSTRACPYKLEASLLSKAKHHIISSYNDMLCMSLLVLSHVSLQV